MISFIPFRVSGVSKSDAENLIHQLYDFLENPSTNKLGHRAGTQNHIVTSKYDVSTSTLTFRILVRCLRTLDNYHIVAKALGEFFDTLKKGASFEITLQDFPHENLGPQILFKALQTFTGKLCQRLSTDHYTSICSFNELTASSTPLAGKQTADAYNWLDELEPESAGCFGIPLTRDTLKRRNSSLAQLFYRKRAGQECCYTLTQVEPSKVFDFDEFTRAPRISEPLTPEFSVPDPPDSVPDYRLHCEATLHAHQFSSIRQSICYTYPNDIIPMYEGTRTPLLQPPARLCLKLKTVGWCCNNNYVVFGPITPRDAALLNEVAIGGCIVVVVHSNYEHMPRTLNTLTESIQPNLVATVFITTLYDYDQIASMFNTSDAVSLTDCYNLDIAEQKKLLSVHGAMPKPDFTESTVAETINDITSKPLSAEKLRQLLENIDMYKDSDITQLYHCLLDKINLSNKLTDEEVNVLELIRISYNIPPILPLKKLDGEIGQKSLKGKLSQRITTYIHQAARRCDSPMSFKLALVGDHGCGKTHYSAIIADILSSIMPELRKTNNNYILVPAHRFYGGDSRVTVQALNDFFYENRGTVIILDELSELLNYGESGIETIKDIIYYIDNPHLNIVVILNDSAEGFFSVCEKIPHAESCIEVIQLSNYSSSELSQIYCKIIKEKYHYESLCTSEVTKELNRCLRSISGENEADGTLVGNARFALHAVENTILAHNDNLLMSAQTTDESLTDADIHKGFSLTLSEYQRRKDGAKNEYKFNSITYVSFADIIGNEAAKGSLMRFVNYIRNPIPYNKVNAKLPRGVLLEGPPGTGKTLLAKALAKEADIPFCYVSGSSFVEKYVGVGAERVRKLFKEARQRKACIIFIDEIDALGSKRDHDSSCQESDRTLNQLLAEMDGFNSHSSNIFVLAATNRVSILDNALTRAGRFDEIINVGLPNNRDRLQMFKKFLGTSADISDSELQSLSNITCGCSGATIHGIVKNAALLAGDKALDKITYAELSASLTTALIGHTASISMLPEEKKRIARHEIGHALILLPQLTLELFKQHKK